MCELWSPRTIGRVATALDSEGLETRLYRHPFTQQPLINIWTSPDHFENDGQNITSPSLADKENEEVHTTDNAFLSRPMAYTADIMRAW